MAVLPSPQMKCHEALEGKCGSRDLRVAQGWKPRHLGAGMCGQACHSVFLRGCVVSHYEMLETVTVRALASALSSGCYSMPVSFPAPFLEMKDVPHPRSLRLEAQNQSQPGSLEGVGESSTLSPKSQGCAPGLTLGTDGPRPLCGSRTGYGVAGATTMGQPGVQATFSFASTTSPTGA